MKVTIVTVAFNSAGTIADTLESVRNQSHTNIEHIVVDGNSKDATMDIVRREGSHLAQVVSEPDAGIYDAMNKGLKLATGDIIGFLNADDVLNDPHAIRRHVECASNGFDVIYGDLVYVRHGDLRSVVRHWRSGAFSPSRLLFGWMPPHPSFYVSKNLLREVGTFDTRFRIAADYDFMLRCLRRPHVRVGYVPDVMVRMRAGGVSNASLSTIIAKSREDLRALRNQGAGGIPTLIAKNLRKVPQFFSSGPD